MALNWVGAFSKSDFVIGKKKGIHKPISCDANTKMIHFSIFPLCGIITSTRRTTKLPNIYYRISIRKIDATLPMTYILLSMTIEAAHRLANCIEGTEIQVFCSQSYRVTRFTVLEPVGLSLSDSSPPRKNMQVPWETIEVHDRQLLTSTRVFQVLDLKS